MSATLAYILNEAVVNHLNGKDITSEELQHIENRLTEVKVEDVIKYSLAYPELFRMMLKHTSEDFHLKDSLNEGTIIDYYNLDHDLKLKWFDEAIKCVKLLRDDEGLIKLFKDLKEDPETPILFFWIGPDTSTNTEW